MSWAGPTWRWPTRSASTSPSWVSDLALVGPAVTRVIGQRSVPSSPIPCGPATTIRLSQIIWDQLWSLNHLALALLNDLVVLFSFTQGMVVCLEGVAMGRAF